MKFQALSGYPLVLLHLPASVGCSPPSSRIRVLTRFHTFSLVFTHSHLDALLLRPLRYVLVHAVCTLYLVCEGARIVFL